MTGSIRFETKSFSVIDDAGNRSMMISRTPVVTDHTNDGPYTYRQRATLTISNGETVTPVSETEFVGIDGKRWRLIQHD